jgi:peptidoglycan hydrolase CwlO-like protein
MAKVKQVKEPDFKGMKAKLDKEHAGKMGKLNKNVQKQIDKHNAQILKLQRKLDAGVAAGKPEAEMQALRDSIAEKQVKVGELQALLPSQPVSADNASPSPEGR